MDFSLLKLIYRKRHSLNEDASGFNLYLGSAHLQLNSPISLLTFCECIRNRVRIIIVTVLRFPDSNILHFDGFAAPE